MLCLYPGVLSETGTRLQTWTTPQLLVALTPRNVQYNVNICEMSQIPENCGKWYRFTGALLQPQAKWAIAPVASTRTTLSVSDPKEKEIWCFYEACQGG